MWAAWSQTQMNLRVQNYNKTLRNTIFINQNEVGTKGNMTFRRKKQKKQMQI